MKQEPSFLQESSLDFDHETFASWIDEFLDENGKLKTLFCETLMPIDIVRQYYIMFMCAIKASSFSLDFGRFIKYRWDLSCLEDFSALVKQCKTMLDEANIWLAQQHFDPFITEEYFVSFLSASTINENYFWYPKPTVKSVIEFDYNSDYECLSYDSAPDQQICSISSQRKNRRLSDRIFLYRRSCKEYSGKYRSKNHKQYRRHIRSPRRN